MSIFQARLSGLLPGQIIDKLKGQVTQYLKDSVWIRHEICDIDDYLVKRKEIIAELLEKHK